MVILYNCAAFASATPSDDEYDTVIVFEKRSSSGFGYYIAADKAVGKMLKTAEDTVNLEGNLVFSAGLNTSGSSASIAHTVTIDLSDSDQETPFEKLLKKEKRSISSYFSWLYCCIKTKKRGLLDQEMS